MVFPLCFFHCGIVYCGGKGFWLLFWCSLCFPTCSGISGIVCFRIWSHCPGGLWEEKTTKGSSKTLQGGLDLLGRFLAVQHRLNPLHIYCRFLDRGIHRGFSASLCRSYEILIFIWLNAMLKLAIYLCCSMKKSCVISDELRKI